MSFLYRHTQSFLFSSLHCCAGICFPSSTYTINNCAPLQKKHNARLAQAKKGKSPLFLCVAVAVCVVWGLFPFMIPPPPFFSKAMLCSVPLLFFLRPCGCVSVFFSLTHPPTLLTTHNVFPSRKWRGGQRRVKWFGLVGERTQPICTHLADRGH